LIPSALIFVPWPGGSGETIGSIRVVNCNPARGL
jgi:hypothetical protein